MDESQTERRKILIVGTIAGFAKKLFRFSILVTVVVLAMNYLFGMGEWTFADIRIDDLARRAPWVSLLIGSAYYVVFQTIGSLAEIPIKSSLLCRMSDAYDQAYAKDFYRRILRLFSIGTAVATMLFCALAFVLRTPLLGLLGHPFADAIVLFIAFFLSSYASPLVGLMFTRVFKRECPKLYYAWIEAVQSGELSEALKMAAIQLF